MRPQPLSTGVGQALRVGRIRRHALDCARERARVGGGDEQSRHTILDDVWNPADIRPDRGNAVAHGIQQGDAQPLGVAARVDDRWKYQQIRCEKCLMELGVGDFVAEIDVHLAIARQRFQPLSFRPDADRHDARIQFSS